MRNLIVCAWLSACVSVTLAQEKPLDFGAKVSLCQDKDNSCIEVRIVSKGSFVERLNIKPGEKILAINNIKMSSEENFKAGWATISKGEAFVIEIQNEFGDKRKLTGQLPNGQLDRLYFRPLK